MMSVFDHSCLMMKGGHRLRDIGWGALDHAPHIYTLIRVCVCVCACVRVRAPGVSGIRWLVAQAVVPLPSYLPQLAGGCDMQGRAVNP